MNGRIASAGMLTIVALVLTACPSKNASDQGTATEAPAATATRAATPKADPDQAILDLLKSGKPATYKVSYTLTTTSKGKTNTGTMGEAWKPPFHRIEIGVADGSRAGSTIVITRPEGTFICGSLFGPAPSCFASPRSGSGGPVFASTPKTIPTEIAGWAIVATAGRNIAGADTRCFTFTSPAGTDPTKAESGTGCFTTEGIPLFWGGKSGTDDVSMTATTYSTTVSDADFALPYPVGKAPGQP